MLRRVKSIIPSILDDSLQSLIRIVLRKEPPKFQEEQLKEIMAHVYANERERAKKKKSSGMD